MGKYKKLKIYRGLSITKINVKTCENFNITVVASNANSPE